MVSANQASSNSAQDAKQAVLEMCSLKIADLAAVVLVILVLSTSTVFFFFVAVVVVVFSMYCQLLRDRLWLLSD